jgi:hypothetical protein
VFGELNGINKLFKTFEYRCVTDFKSPSTVSPLGVYKNGVRLADTDIQSHDLEVGAFQLVTAPVDGDVLDAAYYVQFFTTTEIKQFVTNAAKWLGGATPETIAPGLQSAALEYAKGDAYAALALRYVEHASETYQLEDMPAADRTEAFKTYSGLSESAYKAATKKRDEFYTRQGQSLSPLFGVARGFVRKIP